MVNWLKQQLTDRYAKQQCDITVVDCHSHYLDSILETHGVISDYPQIVGLQIQIDVLGIVKWKTKSEIVFIEAKKTPLNLHDLGQLWAYCKLCNPADAYLLSSSGFGSLDKVLRNLKREDLLDFGDKKKIQKMKVAKWDVQRKEVDTLTIIPKI